MIRFSLSQLLLFVAVVAVYLAVLFAFSWQLLAVLDALLVVFVVTRRRTERFYRLSVADWALVVMVYVLLHMVLWPSLTDLTPPSRRLRPPIPTPRAPATAAGSVSGAVQDLPPDPFLTPDVLGADAPDFDPVGWGLSNAPYPNLPPLTPEVKKALYSDAVEVVDLHNVPLSPEMKSQIARFRRVKWLRMSANFTGSDVQWLGQLEQLRGLSLAHADLTGADLRALAPLQSLQWLNLYEARITGSEFKTLPGLQNLQKLWLGGHHMGDEFITHLVELQLPSLKCLVLYHTSVTDKGVEAVCSGYDLEYVSLFASTRVTERSIPAISRMKTLRVLEIGLTGMCPQCEKNDAVQRLQQALPKCVIYYGS